MNTLIAQYPGLAETRDEVAELFEQLLRDKPIEFHVSYVANIEATFTLLFKVFLDHRDTIFGGADSRIASLILWHFVERSNTGARGCSSPITSPLTDGRGRNTRRRPFGTSTQW